MASQKSDSSHFIRNMMIVMGIVTALSGAAAWRLGSRATITPRTSDTTVADDLSGSAQDAVSITVASSGYTPGEITVPQGKKVRLNLVTNGTYGCIRSFVIPKLGISKTLPTSGTTTVEFTPTEKGTLAFQCSMGMFRGNIKVI